MEFTKKKERLSSFSFNYPVPYSDCPRFFFVPLVVAVEVEPAVVHVVVVF